MKKKHKIPNVVLMNCKFSKVKYLDILNNVKFSIENKKKLKIIYANTKTVNLCNENDKFRDKVSSFDIVHPDGIGVKIASNLLQKKENRFERFNWTDHAHPFLKECESQNWKIFFLGSESYYQAKAKTNLNMKYPELVISGQLNGFEDLNNKSEDIICEKINNSGADILWIGLGTPLQEEWIFRNQDSLNNIPVIQAVGDIFRYLADEKPRGSKLVQKIGLEWFIRLINNPKKYWRRTVIGIPLFFLNMFKSRFTRNDANV